MHVESLTLRQQVGRNSSLLQRRPDADLGTKEIPINTNLPAWTAASRQILGPAYSSMLAACLRDLGQCYSRIQPERITSDQQVANVKAINDTGNTYSWIPCIISISIDDALPPEAITRIDLAVKVSGRTAVGRNLIAPVGGHCASLLVSDVFLLRT